MNRQLNLEKEKADEKLKNIHKDYEDRLAQMKLEIAISKMINYVIYLIVLF